LQLKNLLSFKIIVLGVVVFSRPGGKLSLCTIKANTSPLHLKNTRSPMSHCFVTLSSDELV